MKRTISMLLTVAVLLMVTASMMATSVSAAALLYGDVNADGKINNRDQGVLQQYLNDYEVTVDTTLADVTADGKVNNRDLGILQQYLNDYEVTLGPAQPDVPPEPPVPDFPAVELPAGGYDLNDRGVIVVESVVQNGNTVTVLFANISDKWMSEETSYLEYLCTDAEGNVLSLEDRYYGALYFGMLEVGESVSLTFTLPEGTTKVEFGTCRLVIWSQWQ